MHNRRPSPISRTRELQRRERFRTLVVQSKSSNKAEAAAARFLLETEFKQSTS